MVWVRALWCQACGELPRPPHPAPPRLHPPRLGPLPLGRYIPFSGGPRKCVGDQFALMEAVSVLSILLSNFDFSPVPGHDPGMTTGATIHTKNGLLLRVARRAAGGGDAAAAGAAAAEAVPA